MEEVRQWLPFIITGILLSPPFWRFVGFMFRNYFLQDLTTAIRENTSTSNLLQREIDALRTDLTDHEDDSEMHGGIGPKMHRRRPVM